jgi:hypothetical protein
MKNERKRNKMNASSKKVFANGPGYRTQAQFDVVKAYLKKRPASKILTEPFGNDPECTGPFTFLYHGAKEEKETLIAIRVTKTGRITKEVSSGPEVVERYQKAGWLK